MADAKQITFEVKEELGVISEGSRGWKKELNLVSWNGNEPKYDIRDWAPEREKLGKGVTLTKEELTTLGNLIAEELK